MDETTVVVADDHELLRSGLMAILDRTATLRVVGEAETGTDAVETVRILRPHVVLMDIRMPGIDGIEATRRILADPACVTSVVVLTTFDDESVMFAALRAGAAGFILKDAATDDIVRAIQAARTGEALLSPSVTRRIIRAALRAPTPPDPPGQSQRVPEWRTSLTPREREVLDLVAAGLSNDEIGLQLRLSVATIKTHIRSLLLKIGGRSRVDLVIAAYGGGTRPQQDR